MGGGGAKGAGLIHESFNEIDPPKAGGPEMT
jgi:hypothetical protein